MSKMTTCKVCGKEIAKSAKSCPSCGAKLKMGLLKKLGIGFAIIFAIAIISSLGDDNSSNSSASSNSSSNKTASTTKSPEEIAKELEQFKSECQTIPYKDMARNPKDYIGKKITYTGKVIQVIENGNNIGLRVNVTKTDFGYDDTVYVNYVKKSDEGRILEDDIIALWGEAKDLKSYKSTLGAQITIPQIDARAIQVLK